MKYIFKKLSQLFFYLFNFKKVMLFKDFEKKLGEAVIDKQAHQVILMQEISKEIQILWPKGRSKFIPLSFPQRIDMRAKIHSKFGEKMEKLHVKMNNNLQFI